jgi:hypothetical protein
MPNRSPKEWNFAENFTNHSHRIDNIGEIIFSVEVFLLFFA